MKEYLEDFYLGLDEPQKSALLALRKIILEFDSDISETMACLVFFTRTI